MRTCCLAPFLILFILLIGVSPASAAPQYRYTMTYTFENRGTSPATLLRDDASVPLFPQTQRQRFTVTSATPPLGAEYTDVDGNRLADSGMPLTIPAGAKLTYTVVFNIESSDEPYPNLNITTAGTTADIPSALVSEYTGSTGTFMSDNAEIAELAGNLTATETTVLGKLARLIEWFYKNVDYLNHETPLYPDQMLKLKKGDCDDQSILLISMLRSLGIPSYLGVGIVIGTGVGGTETTWDGHLSIDEKGLGWHGWAMVYTPPWGWLPVDLTLVHDADPLQMIRTAPQHSAAVLTAFVVSKQEYTTLGVETRQRIINSTIYVTSTEIVEALQAGWIDPTMILLAAALVGAVALMFYTSRRHSKKQTI